MDAIYERPLDYDLEHERDEEDVSFYADLVRRLQPRRVLELACGSGRVTIPLACLAPELGFEIVGLEIAEPMLAQAERKRSAIAPESRARMSLVRGDLRTWRADEPLCHVYYPRELELLFRWTGFEVESVFGDYARRRFGPSSRQTVMIGRKT